MLPNLRGFLDLLVEGDLLFLSLDISYAHVPSRRFPKNNFPPYGASVAIGSIRGELIARKKLGSLLSSESIDLAPDPFYCLLAYPSES